MAAQMPPQTVFAHRPGGVSFFRSPVPAPKDHPEVIILFTWMGVHTRHVTKYTDSYRALFPASHLLVVSASPVQVMCAAAAVGGLRQANMALEELYHRPEGVQKSPGSQGGQVIRGDSEGKGDGILGARVLVHIFSNGGAVQYTRLLDLAGPQFPAHVAVLDLCPGYFHFQSSATALRQVSPGWAVPLVYLYLAFSWLRDQLFGSGGSPGEASAVRMNTEDVREIAPCRVYLYGKMDEIVSWRDIEDHAAKSVTWGFKVRLERFEMGRHVQNARDDPERYWNAVKTVWEMNQSHTTGIQKA
ncbi:hypothetical protein CFIMG_005336RA [Ceratocystis fimbriata CBS 114723]|uniref:Transmembrane protein 53 n=1 Tax=Ceratocystis fimbriata CBS 114723 TaxID=1035309 RepID=A0A2C5X440_9PEZI|nr:hypothetical protein CFIMG_005336RA [Ceratocystis fimbriata CBS 114723]